MLTRRKMLIGLSAVVAAPAVISYSNLMPVKLVQTRPYAIVHGIGLDGFEKIMELWEATSPSDFGGKAHEYFKTVTSWEGASLSDQDVANFIKNREAQKLAAYDQWRNTDVWGQEIQWPDVKSQEILGFMELEKKNNESRTWLQNLNIYGKPKC